ncbi:hypothetical protein Taro_027436 [Colocasia esculenta]|uniref:Uncharacterized protein n=1 Tax=Colocasia esculenta TaxID=4460 RepID=A0A843VNQ4_COLES|nr:hypothetical protein [Colocasia esculenta]
MSGVRAERSGFIPDSSGLSGQICCPGLVETLMFSWVQQMPPTGYPSETKATAGLTMPRSTKHRGESSRASRRSEDDVWRTKVPMLYFTLSLLREEDLEQLDRGVKVCALGPLEESSPLEGTVDMRRLYQTEQGYRYQRGRNYPGHFPLYEHLFPFTQGFVPVNWDGPDELLKSERVQLERAILAGRDSMMGTCSFHYPSFPIDYTAQPCFPLGPHWRRVKVYRGQLRKTMVRTFTQGWNSFYCSPWFSPGRRGTSRLAFVLIHFAGGAEIVAEMMEMGPSVAVFPPAATQAGAEDAPCGVMTTPLLSEPSEPLTAAGGNAPQPPFAAASPVGLAPFPSHDVFWPSEPQSIQMVDNGGVLETLMGLTRSAMEESSPPCLERVRGFLYRNTLAYHLMGYPRDPWMAAVGAVCDEVKQRYQEATRLNMQEFSAEIALAEQRSEALRSQRGGVVSRVETLRAGCAQCHDDIVAIQWTIEEASKRLIDRQAAYRALTEGAAEAEAAATALEQEYADSQARLSVLQASLADLRRGPHTSL